MSTIIYRRKMFKNKCFEKTFLTIMLKALSKGATLSCVERVFFQIEQPDMSVYKLI